MILPIVLFLLLLIAPDVYLWTEYIRQQDSWWLNVLWFMRFGGGRRVVHTREQGSLSQHVHQGYVCLGALLWAAQTRFRPPSVLCLVAVGPRFAHCHTDSPHLWIFLRLASDSGT